MSETFQIVIRMAKQHTAITYFQFEANEGIAFYSTLEHETGQEHRDIDFRGHVSYYEETLRLLNVLGKKFPISFLKNDKN